MRCCRYYHTFSTDSKIYLKKLIFGTLIFRGQQFKTYFLIFRRRENRAKRLKDEPSVHYTSKWNRKNTADPPTKIFSSPVFVDPSSQTVREGSERCPSEDSVISSEVGEIRMKEDELSPSLNTIRSDDNIQGIGGACNVQNDVKESIYDVPPVHHVDTAKLVD